MQTNVLCFVDLSTMQLRTPTHASLIHHNAGREQLWVCRLSDGELSDVEVATLAVVFLGVIKVQWSDHGHRNKVMAYSMCITQGMPAGLTGKDVQIDYIAACVACAGLKVSDRCQTVILIASKINLPSYLLELCVDSNWASVKSLGNDT